MRLLLIIILFNSPLYSQIVVNEIMPAPDGGEPEWIEIYNKSSESQSFDTLLICDAVKCCEINNFSLSEQHYAVITSDTAALKAFRQIPQQCIVIEANLPIFNNSWDNVILKYSDNVIDSVFYEVSWGYAGNSLERINSEIPAVSSDNLIASNDETGASCGRKNSVTAESNFGSKINITPNPFSPYGSENICTISYNFSEEKSIVNASIYNIKGLLIKDIANNLQTIGRGALVFDGKNESGQILPIGPYVVIIEVVNSKTGNIQSEKKMIVIGK